ncbi:hypothetical protein LMG28727_07366 [Paraburkholderia kirstenboschensis]|nr:hypothetical protein LMG28727_07366 [Paraburkholderia kirstenboschensis]
MQHARGAHQLAGHVRGMHDRGAFCIEHAGARQQVIGLILQRDAHRAEEVRIHEFMPSQLIDHEVEQHPPLASTGPASARMS